VRLRVARPPCEGEVRSEGRHRCRNCRGRLRQLRDHHRRPARLFQAGLGRLPHRRRDRRAAMKRAGHAWTV